MILSIRHVIWRLTWYDINRNSNKNIWFPVFKSPCTIDCKYRGSVLNVWKMGGGAVFLNFTLNFDLFRHKVHIGTKFLQVIVMLLKVWKSDVWYRLTRMESIFTKKLLMGNDTQRFLLTWHIFLTLKSLLIAWCYMGWNEVYWTQEKRL